MPGARGPEGYAWGYVPTILYLSSLISSVEVVSYSKRVDSESFLYF